jgi:hypothetical protein
MSIVAENSIVNHPEFPGLVVKMTACAKTAMPQAVDRIERAALLVLRGGVQPSPMVKCPEYRACGPGRTWRVTSTRQGTVPATHGAEIMATLLHLCGNIRGHAPAHPHSEYIP